MEEWSRQREEMVATDLKGRGIADPRILASMGEVPREEFVPESIRSYAYEDGPLPIGYNQTISQPYIVAYMTEAAALQNTDSVLDIGTGSGYAAAVLSRIVKKVYSIERIIPLAEQARHACEMLGYDNIEIAVGDGTLGWKERAPFDAIITTAAAPDVPQSLVEQLAPGGRLVIPVGDPLEQQLIRVTKKEDGQIYQEGLQYVRFVPLIGEEGWNEE